MKTQVCAQLILAGILLLVTGGISFAQEAAKEATADDNIAMQPTALDPVLGPAVAPLPPINKGDTAWMLVSSALVLMMTAPGLALFYGGLVRKKNILGVMMQCIVLMGLMSVIWVAWGYSLAFDKNIGEGTLGKICGGFSLVMLKGVGAGNELQGKTIPDLLHMVYQMMFFIITPGLICGAFAERMKFSAMVLFCGLWARSCIARWLTGSGPPTAGWRAAITWRWILPAARWCI